MDFTAALAEFPAPLRRLVEAELQAGNSILSLGSGYPAAPCGASVRLARAVAASRRKSTGELSFFERNGSSHSGEFTTAERHFFVLEPPLPPAPEADMDALRQSYAPRSEVAPPAPRRSRGSKTKASVVPTVPPKPTPSGPRRAVTLTESETGLSYQLHFRDRRPPHEVQHTLERRSGMLFQVAVEEDQLVMRAAARQHGDDYQLQLQFVAALPAENAYSFRVTVTWKEGTVAPTPASRISVTSRLQAWTRDWSPSAQPARKANAAEDYAELSQQALTLEAHLDSSAAVQRAILDGLKQGGRFIWSDKESDTQIVWRDGRFLRLHEGDRPEQQVFRDEGEFLKMLWQYCQFDLTFHGEPTPQTEFEAWKRILRRLSPS